MPSPFDFISSFNTKKQYLLESSLDEKDYNPFIINKGLSFTSDAILFANEVNSMWGLDKKLQHDFYFFGLPKSKQFGKWIKKDQEDAFISTVAEYYCINKSLAVKYIDMLSEEQLQQIRDRMDKGGKA